MEAAFAPEDHVVLKMDIEGEEFPTIRRMINEQTLRLVDELFLDCHEYRGAEYKTSCAELFAALHAHYPNLQGPQRGGRSLQAAREDPRGMRRRMASCQERGRVWGLRTKEDQ